MATSSRLELAPTSAAFLSDVLGASVDVIDVSFVEGGLLSDADRMRLACRDSRVAIPTSVVVKIPSSAPEGRQHAVSVAAYTKELNSIRTSPRRFRSGRRRSTPVFRDWDVTNAAYLSRRYSRGSMICAAVPAGQLQRGMNSGHDVGFAPSSELG
jgi:hypothetical protein